MTTPEPFELRSRRLGCLPVVNAFLDRMGLAGHLAEHLPHDDARLRLAPAAVVGLVVRNITASRRPVYALAEWAAPHDPALLGLGPGEAACLNDDRVGRALDRLFDADRAACSRTTRPAPDPRVRHRPGRTAQRLHHRHLLRDYHDAAGRGARGGQEDPGASPSGTTRTTAPT